MGEIEIKDFNDLLLMQRELDNKIYSPRENNHIPAKPNLNKIILSIIAEIIEYNEETPDTHKTWKEKTFDEEKMKEEAIDILFFFLQHVNYNLEREDCLLEVYKEKFKELWEDEWEEKNICKVEEIALIRMIIDSTFRGSGAFIRGLVNLYKKIGMTKEEVYKRYFEKWQKNTGRIKGDWTK